MGMENKGEVWEKFWTNWSMMSLILHNHHSLNSFYEPGSITLTEIQPVHPKGNQSWIFIGRTDAEAPILWPPDANNWLIGKGPDAGEDWRKDEKGKTDNEMLRWQHQLDGHESEQALGVGDGQGSLACCSPWGRQESDMIERLNWGLH